MSRLRVGLSYPAYTIQTVGRGGAPVEPRTIDWQTDAKHYEFWAFADNSGRFPSHRRPARQLYRCTLSADGVLGELAKADVTVTAGKPLDLGTIDWTPDRRGKQIWEIGYPNRTGAEFAKGDDYAHDGMFLVYAKLFPSDVNYVVGKSDYRKDWFFEQVLPHSRTAPPNQGHGLQHGRHSGPRDSLDDFVRHGAGAARQGAPAARPGCAAYTPDRWWSTISRLARSIR